MSGTREFPIDLEEELGFSRENPIMLEEPETEQELPVPEYPHHLYDMSKATRLGGIVYEYAEEELQVMAFIENEVVWIPLNRINEAPDDVKIKFYENYRQMEIAFHKKNNHLSKR